MFQVALATLYYISGLLSNYCIVLYRRECFTGKYTTREFVDDVISVIFLEICRRLAPFAFYIYFKAFLIFFHCRALFSSVLFLKNIVTMSHLAVL